MQRRSLMAHRVTNPIGRLAKVTIFWLLLGIFDITPLRWNCRSVRGGGVNGGGEAGADGFDCGGVGGGVGDEDGDGKAAAVGEDD